MEHHETIEDFKKGLKIIKKVFLSLLLTVVIVVIVIPILVLIAYHVMDLIPYPNTIDCLDVPDNTVWYCQENDFYFEKCQNGSYQGILCNEAGEKTTLYFSLYQRGVYNYSANAYTDEDFRYTDSEPLFHCNIRFYEDRVVFIIKDAKARKDLDFTQNKITFQKNSRNSS